MRKQEGIFASQTIWSSIDPEKVKQRIDTITKQLDKVRRKFEPQSEVKDDRDRD